MAETLRIAKQIPLSITIPKKRESGILEYVPVSIGCPLKLKPAFRNSESWYRLKI